VLCRAGEIRQVFANLISNAIDAMPHGGSLLLVTRPFADGAEIEVADTGEGIGENLQAKILDPFFTTKGASGTGLGLSICAEIMQRHGGSLRFTSSTTPGKSGTRFILYLPRTMAANA
jgi:signal transduction histidine kinase